VAQGEDPEFKPQYHQKKKKSPPALLITETDTHGSYFYLYLVLGSESVCLAKLKLKLNPQSHVNSTWRQCSWEANYLLRLDEAMRVRSALRHDCVSGIRRKERETQDSKLDLSCHMQCHSPAECPLKVLSRHWPYALGFPNLHNYEL
jgi:hypothetical protein